MGDMKLFLSLDNAVKVCCSVFDADKEDEIALRSELEQKCYISNDQYSIGYHDALKDAMRSIKELDKI